VTDYKLNVTLKYCGSCNPLIDPFQVGSRLKEAILNEPGLKLVAPDDKSIDVVVILCGCPRACGNKESIRRLAKNSIVVAGASVDQVPMAEKELPAQVMQKVRSFCAEGKPISRSPAPARRTRRHQPG